MVMLIRDALPMMCLSEYMYHNKNEYFEVTGLSFNSTAKAIDLLQEQGILVPRKEIVFGNICHSKIASCQSCNKISNRINF